MVKVKKKYLKVLDLIFRRLLLEFEAIQSMK